jgi:serine/threonine protein kinase
MNKIVSHYRLLEKIGEGGMGVVYKAEDMKLKRTVALKFLPPELTRDRQAKARFIQEAQAAAALDHPNICAVFEIGEAENATYIAMPYVKGRSLKERIQAGPLSMEEALDIAGQVAEGLKEAHERGIIHRDIKPANIMLTEKGQAKIMDFGLAKLEAGVDLTKTMAVMGTVAYMSPEQARGEEVDHRTDIWSFGATLYEMLTGQKPFGQKHDQALLYSILNDTTEAVSRIRPEIPNYLDRVIQKALEKDRSRRYQDMVELLKDLKSTQVPGLGLPKAEKSIIVLPFEDISPGKDNEYFCDGMTEEIITDLSHVHDLLVISRSSAMTFKGTKKTISEIAHAVNVRFILEGSVRKAGNNLRITAQLIDAANDAHLWAEKYAGTLDDVFDIQEQVSRSIVSALKLQLIPEEERLITNRPLTNIHAYDAYLKARQDIWRWTKPALERAQLHLENALAIVGENALLFAGLGSVYVTYAHATILMDEETLTKAEQFAGKAARLEPELAQCHSLLASIAMARGQMKQSFRHAQRALSINPFDPDALLFFIGTSVPLGKTPFTAASVDRFVKTDPLSALPHACLGNVSWAEGRVDALLGHARTAYRLDPESQFARWWIVYGLLANHLFEEAKALLDPWSKEVPDNAMPMMNVFLLHALRGDLALALQSVTERWKSQAWQDYWAPFTMAEGYALLGQTAEALRWLEHAIDKGWINYPLLADIDPFLANIRGEPRFQKLMQRVKYEWEHFEV